MTDVMMPDPGAGPSMPLSRRQLLSQTFESYRQKLDSDNERRERLIILSRSITQQSKRLIFHLHRGATNSNDAARAKNIEDAKSMQKKIIDSFVKVYEELRGASPVESYWKWNRQVSPGLEEFIEGISFLHFLENRSLISHEEVQDVLSSTESKDPYVIVTPDDYVLGISDLTGELMRYATNALSTGDHETPLEVCSFVRSVKTCFDGISPQLLYKLSKKQEETTRSLEKIEKVCYSLKLRMIEFADRPDLLKQMAERALEDAKDDRPQRREEFGDH